MLSKVDNLLTLLQAISHVGSHERQRLRKSCGNSPQGIAHSSLSTWHTKPPVPEPPLKDLLANEVITLTVTGPHTGYQSTLQMSYISNRAVIFTIMCLYEDVSVLWCVYRGQKITFRS